MYYWWISPDIAHGTIIALNVFLAAARKSGQKQWDFNFLKNGLKFESMLR